MMQTCKTCAHWAFDKTDWFYGGIEMGECKAIKMREEIIELAREIDDWEAREAEEERLVRSAKAIAVDGSGYYAAIRSTGDFGCVLHKESAPTEAEALVRNP